MTRHDLLIEIANCTQAIKAFEIGAPWLAPDGLHEVPGVEWLKAQQRACRRQLARLAQRDELAPPVAA